MIRIDSSAGNLRRNLFIFSSWVMLLVSIAATMAWVLIRGEGLCLACGYDLRGSEELCPECGKPSSRVTGLKRSGCHGRLA
jgi:predicted amidophosphoribosyltransferase